MATIYRKTEKGLAEIATRAHRVVPRLRSALIMVDGKRSDEELRKLILPPADEALQALIDDGFIDAIAVTAERPALRPATAAGQSPASAGVLAAPPVATPVLAVLTPDEVRKRAVRWINDKLGPYAEIVSIKLERAKSRDDLRAALANAETLVQNQLGAARLAEFQRDIVALLPPPG